LKLKVLFSSMASIESAKKKAAVAAVDEFVKKTSELQPLGIGSGSTIVYAVQRLAERVKEEKLQVTCIPTSFQAQELIIEHGLQLGDLQRYPVLDVVIDGADEVDCELNLLKGGGGCQTQEKIVAACSKAVVIIADYRKDSKMLGTSWVAGIPIEVIPMAVFPVMNKLTSLGGKAKIRMGKSKAGPCITDNGNMLIDVHFGPIPSHKVGFLNRTIKMLAGVVETGLFVNMATKVFFGQENGTVISRVASTKRSDDVSDCQFLIPGEKCKL